MDRSPTPERPRRAAPKRARTTPVTVANVKTGQTSKENKPPSSDDDNDVDVGVLLASLPPQSLLPLLTSLLSAHPSLKPVVLSLIPRPTLDTALQALATSAHKLRDAYPYSSPPFSQAGLASTFGGFGGGFGSNKSNTSASTTGFGFGRLTAGPSFGHPHSNNTGMRDEYIISRLRPHISDFVSACFSYLPYFSNVSAPLTSPSFSKPSNSMDIQSHSSALRQQHKDKLHPTETFLFLSALTTHILSQPPLTLFSLAPQLLPRLSEEWKAWVDHIDEVVNRQGGMFGKETVNSWERALDEFAEAKGNGMEVMKEIRDRWVSKVGWLVGRQPMEEL
ncbi:hypothetical protein A0H81_00817 [Grifola frondosa]|uniref:Tethering factor for nuclear proteasome STS1 n=1 Tax=Grifola frondosa TaxID=5627 RepID=A0A1C7MPC8_GRIFR|nr:hypothetical protein A0H81_00817 [Grifola frondosa]